MVGIKPRGKICVEWSANLAYVIGLITTDGCLSSDGRHIIFVSKDYEQISNFVSCLGIEVKIGVNLSGSKDSVFRVQFGDVLFYQFLISLGLTPAKSKTIKGVELPDEFFFDFLRGCFDGDGSFYSYWDPRWKSSYMFYLSIASASKEHIYWLQSRIQKMSATEGHIVKAKNNSAFQLRYAKKDTIKILRSIYYSDNVVCLSRKRLKITKALGIIGEQI